MKDTAVGCGDNNPTLWGQVYPFSSPDVWTVQTQ
nr:MAG TPA: hypothetical protein [Caudoviricetes sp.]